MASTRRIGAESSATRTILIDAAEQLMLEDGYAAVTSRRVAAKAGLKPQLVHYYFRTMDDLVVAVIRRSGELNLDRMAQARALGHPLQAVWTLTRDSKTAALSMEFLALANHRKAVRDEVKRYAEQTRLVQTAALTRYFERNGLTPKVPPITATLAMTGILQLLVLEAEHGISLGHAETEACLEEYLCQFTQSDGRAEDVAEPPSNLSEHRPLLTRGNTGAKRALSG
jgi:AcrR family transcriptional regulator